MVVAATPRGAAVPYEAADALAPDRFESIRRALVLHGFKWDPQVGDVGTLAPFPLVLARGVWRELARTAERLTAEALAAERELLERPALLATLGVLRRIRRVLARTDAAPTPAAARVMRFDFHFTGEGWRISEVNSDVPGGYSEATRFAALVAAEYPGASPIGKPGERWAEALARAAHGGTVALLSAPCYLEDHQVVHYLASELRARGCRCELVRPEQIQWSDGRARLETAWCRDPVDTIVRFYQAEWLAGLPARTGWANFFRGGTTPVANPGTAILLESKRFPLVWDELTTPLPTWRALLPETRNPREVAWRKDESWLLKLAYSNTGDSVACWPLEPPKRRAALARDVWLHPGSWAAQRRFVPVPIDTPLGPRHVCVGVYTIDGRAAGVYGRMSAKAIIDYSAEDVAVLTRDGDGDGDDRNDGREGDAG